MVWVGRVFRTRRALSVLKFGLGNSLFINLINKGVEAPILWALLL
nr:MAG TPA: hypothetical protein [Caudoviricetes sp.]